MVDWPVEPTPTHAPALDTAVLDAWARRVEAAAALNAMRVNPVPGRREIEPWLSAWRGDAASGGATSANVEVRQPDVRLWRALVLKAPAPTELFDGDPSNLGPILANRHGMTLEVWTESDLCALHAVWHLAARDLRADWRRRCILAALWHAEYLQPDNATHVPWALHVFVIGGLALARAGDERAASVSLHAQTLLHNAVVAVDRPDSLSAGVFADSAAALRRELIDPPPHRGGGNA